MRRLSSTHYCLFRLLTFALAIVCSQSAQAQTFTVLHAFTGGQDGGEPSAGLTLDKAGNLYGTTDAGGVGFGTVFKLSHKGSGWVFSPLYSFQGDNDGEYPGTAGVTIGSDGSLYGTTFSGGGSGCVGGSGCGTVFSLRPQPSACKTALCPWNETVLYRFTGGGDGANPDRGVIFDPAGKMYLSSFGYGDGIIVELTPSNGGWEETRSYIFDGGNGDSPSGLILDTSGNLYGVAGGGGVYGYGLAFELTTSGSGWTENVLYTFQGGSDGLGPAGGLIFDNSGDLYGVTHNGGGSGCYGRQGCGTVFELTPSSGGQWIESILYSFTGGSGDFGGPQASLTMDAAGNLYGTTNQEGAYGYGSAFKLTPSNGGWTYIDLHDFTGGSDGGYPLSDIIFDAHGNLYGTTEAGGEGCLPSGCGVVWEITP